MKLLCIRVMELDRFEEVIECCDNKLRRFGLVEYSRTSTHNRKLVCKYCGEIIGIPDFLYFGVAAYQHICKEKDENK